MSLKHAILGFLNYQPYTGYDLKTVFDMSVRHFWPADRAQIYRTLAELTEEGLVTVEVVPQDARPNKKVYSITDAGRTELQRWLRTPLPPQESRSAPLVQVFFAGQLPDEDILRMFEDVAGQLRAVLAMYDQIPGQIQPCVESVNSPRETFFWLLTLEAGIRSMRANLEWCESVIEQIKNKQHPEK